MNRQSKADRVAEELAAIPNLSRGELIERWQAAYGRLPPKGLTRRLLEYSAAYHVQVRASGALKSFIRRELIGLLKPDGDPDRRERSTPRQSVLSPGTRLVREWRGTTHTVDVLDKGLLYDGETYRSLSQIANIITGAKWSGPRFFGL